MSKWVKSQKIRDCITSLEFVICNSADDDYLLDLKEIYEKLLEIEIQLEM